MTDATSPRTNNFSTLRVLFASLVILSHSFEILEGGRTHEILYRIFGTISFGDLAVDGFFLISGYLITKSYIYSSHTGYFVKRVLRIYPGFMVAFIVSILICLYCSSDSFSSFTTKRETLHNIVNLFFLMPPVIQTAYKGSYYAVPDGAMWTISYEFHCYLLIMFLGFFGLIKRGRMLLALTIGLLIISLIHPDIAPPPPIDDTYSISQPQTDSLKSLLHLIKSISIEKISAHVKFLAFFLWVAASTYIANQSFTEIF